jgi:predicted DNA-binding protein
MSKNGEDLLKCKHKIEEVIPVLEDLLARTKCKFVKEVLPGQISMLKSISYAEEKMREMANGERRELK